MQTHAAHWEAASRVNQKYYAVIFLLQCFMFLYSSILYIWSFSFLLEVPIVTARGASITHFHLGWQINSFSTTFQLQGKKKSFFCLVGVFFVVFFLTFLPNSNGQKLFFFLQRVKHSLIQHRWPNKTVWSQSFQSDISGNESLLRTWGEISWGPGVKIILRLSISSIKKENVVALRTDKYCALNPLKDVFKKSSFYNLKRCFYIEIYIFFFNRNMKFRLGEFN